jgi:hypothetical protein
VPPSPLSSRPERSAVERSAVHRTLLGNVFLSKVRKLNAGLPAKLEPWN